MALLLVQRPQQRQYLATAQRQLLRQLLQVQLRDPEFPNAVKGLDGMLAADKLLKERNARGLLIDSCAKALWNYRCTPGQLADHKDVDVAVLDSDFSLAEKFEAGIDWWLPREERLTIFRDYGSKEIRKLRWWKNGNEVILTCGAEYNEPRLKELVVPGLYLPERSLVIDSEVKARTAHLPHRIERAEDVDVIDVLEKKLEKDVKTRRPSWFQKYFPQPLLSDADGYSSSRYASVSCLRLLDFDKDVLATIKKYEEGKEETH